MTTIEKHPYDEYLIEYEVCLPARTEDGSKEQEVAVSVSPKHGGARIIGYGFVQRGEVPEGAALRTAGELIKNIQQPPEQ